jgi:hypothetical protein
MNDGWFVNARGNLCKRYGDIKAPPKRGAFPCPMIATDTMEPVRSMADGKMYSSKAALRATYLENGNPQGIRYTEVGNEKPDVKPMQGDREGVRTAIKRAKQMAGL